VQGSADAGGATPVTAHRPIAAAEATDIETIRKCRGMTHLSRGATSPDVGQLTDVTIVINGTVATSDA